MIWSLISDPLPKVWEIKITQMSFQMVLSKDRKEKKINCSSNRFYIPVESSVLITTLFRLN